MDNNLGVHYSLLYSFGFEQIKNQTFCKSFHIIYYKYFSDKLLRNQYEAVKRQNIYV